MATVPDAKAHLLAALQAHEVFEGVQVEWAHPGKNIELETVYFGDTSPYSQRAAALGKRDRDENYELELIVTVEKRGNDPEAAERRCWELVGGVEAVLRDDPDADLGGTVRLAQLSTGPVRNFVGDGRRVAECVLSVRVEADV